MTIVLRLAPGNEKVRTWSILAAGLLIGFFLVMVVHFLVDQSRRGLQSTKKTLSYYDSYEEHLAVKDFLLQKGLKKGDYTGLVGEPPVYWGRMAGVKIVGEIEDENQFIESSRDERRAAIDTLKQIGVKALIAKGERFSTMAAEGWERAPRTSDYYVLFLMRRAPET